MIPLLCLYFFFFFFCFQLTTTNSAPNHRSHGCPLSPLLRALLTHNITESAPIYSLWSLRPTGWNATRRTVSCRLDFIYSSAKQKLPATRAECKQQPCCGFMCYSPDLCARKKQRPQLGVKTDLSHTGKLGVRKVLIRDFEQWQFPGQCPLSDLDCWPWTIRQFN